MSPEIEELKLKAECYRDLYRMGKIGIEEAKENILPYLQEINQATLRIAVKYNQKPKRITFSTFVR